MANSRRSPILEALDSESYDFLEANYPDLLAAIEIEVSEGAKPDEIYKIVNRHVGPDRWALTMRIRQAANHISRMYREKK